MTKKPEPPKATNWTLYKIAAKAVPAGRGARCQDEVLLNEHLAEDGATVFAHTCQLGADHCTCECGYGARVLLPADYSVPTIQGLQRFLG
jgi:hypothetical protein